MTESRMSADHGEDLRLQHYLQHIECYGKLTKEEEFGLSRRIRSGDREALDHLVNANLCHVVAIAGEFRHHGLGEMDLIAEGTVGLITAARSFDSRRGIRFISFAKLLIGRAIRKAIVVHVRTPNLPSTMVIWSLPQQRNPSVWAD